MTFRTMPIVSVLLLFAKVASAELVVPSLVTNGKHQNDPLVKAGYLDATLYGADPAGKTDSTSAIQKAMNDARDNAMVTYLPAGTYLVSDTLLGTQVFGNPGCASANFAYGSSAAKSAPQAPSLVGPPSGPRATLVLEDASAGFGDTKNLKPVVRIVSSPNGGGDSTDPLTGSSDCLFYAVVRDVDLQLGKNPGAIGIQFYSAQYSYMENVSVDATGAFAGFEGAPATEIWVNLAVTGGQFGIIMNNACGVSTLAGVTLRNQTVAGLALGACGSQLIAGFDIAEPSGTAIYAASGPAPMNSMVTIAQGANVALIDGTIDVAVGSAPAIVNGNGRGLYVQNVYVKTTGSLVQSSTNAAIAGSGGRDLVEEYSYTDKSVHAAAGQNSPMTAYTMIDGVKTQNEIAKVIKSLGDVPTDLVTRHVPGQLPWHTDAGVIDVTTVGADPTGKVDSTAAIQNAIGMGDEVFLPRGDYVISATITLDENTHIFGVPGSRTRLFAPSWHPTDFAPFIRTADSAMGKTYVGDLYLLMPDDASSASVGLQQSYLSGLEWQTGRSSIANQVALDMAYDDASSASQARKMVHVDKHGGGRFFGLQEAFDGRGSRQDNVDFRALFVDGTTEPLTFYGMNPEHLAETMIDVTNATHVRFLGLKTEINHPLFAVSGSQNVMVAAVNGDYEVNKMEPIVSFTDSTNIAASLIGYYPGLTGFPNSPTGFIVTATDSKGTSDISGDNAASLFEAGAFDATVFPHCGDGACNLDETAMSCPSDCGATAADAGMTGRQTAQPDGAGGTVSPMPQSSKVAGGCSVASARTPSPFPLMIVALALLWGARRRNSQRNS